MLVIGALGLGEPSYWRDEAATLDAEARSYAFVLACAVLASYLLALLR